MQGQKGPREKDQKKGSGAKVIYVDNFKPRMPHPRQLISRNYHHIENHQTLSKRFQRSNFIASCRTLPNLGEILSPTVQKKLPPSSGGGDDQSRGGRSGFFYCENSRRGIHVIPAVI